MKRRLVNFDAFNKMKNESLSKAEAELIEAEGVLSQALGIEDIYLNSFTESSVMYETLDNTYIHASYQVNKDNITFDNIEELVINEEEEKANAKNIVRDMVENILDGNDTKAGDLFSQYINTSIVKKTMSEAVIVASVGRPTKRSPLKGRRQNRADVMKRVRARKKRFTRLSKGQKLQAAHLRKRLSANLPHRKGARVYIRYKDKPGMKKMMKEWAILAENVLGYVDFREFGPILNESVVKHDDRGNVVAIRIPTSNLRNEAKILQWDWKTLNTDVKVLREQVLNLSSDQNFMRAMSDLKRENALSDNKSMQTVLEHIVAAWPNLLFVTATELSNMISEALKATNASNYDDSVCEFLAEGILRTAHKTYSEKVERVLKLANATNDASYEHFQNVVSSFYPNLDESTSIEMGVFTDLYNSLVEIHEIANKDQNVNLIEQVEAYLKELYPIVTGDAKPDVELAEEVAMWIGDLVETNLETSDWDVSNTPHISINGDHPRMAQNAKQGYQPSSDFSGDWGDPAPVSDGKNYKGGLADEMRSKSWGNSGGETYPNIQNPYTPKAGEFTMKNEKGVDKDDDNFGTWQSGDTWPNIQNPYIPKGVTPMTYKMKSDNLVVDQ